MCVQIKSKFSYYLHFEPLLVSKPIDSLSLVSAPAGSALLYWSL